MANSFDIWKEAMKAWLKEIIKWQQAHPDKDWLTELQSESDDDGGDRPPTPPKNAFTYY